MANTFAFERLGPKDRDEYREFIPRDIWIGNKSDYVLGIRCNGSPGGAVILQRQEETLVIRSMRVDDTAIREEACVEALQRASRMGRHQRCKKMTYRFTDDELDILKKAGFTSFKKEASVYEIDAARLADVLEFGDHAQGMRRECVRLINENKVRCFSKSRKNAKLFERLYPDGGLSFMTIDPKGRYQSYTIVSELSDGSLYLGDFLRQPDHTDDFEGLLYMSLGAVFMRIAPADSFYVAAVEQRFEKLVRRYFGTSMKGIYAKEIYVGTCNL